MANPELLEEQREETRLIIEELLEDGSDPDALYTIEHHLSADDFETLEKVAVEAFKLGYEVTEPEELEVEEGEVVICCDILSESALKVELIDAQVEQLMTLAEKFGVEYDGWGTYYEDPNGEEGDEEDDDDLVDEDDDGVRHYVNLHVILQAASLLATHRNPGDIVLYVVGVFVSLYPEQ